MSTELAEWVTKVFGQADASGVDDPQRLEGICGPDEPTLRRLIEVFENPARFLGEFPDAVLDQAFWDVSDCTFKAVYDPEIGWDLRARLIRSFATVFRELFAVRCAPVLDHREAGYRPLNSACSMWWDFNCWLAINRLPRDHPIEPAFDCAMLETIQAVLTIDHIACQESALHGLGHWHPVHPAAVESLIGGFLEQHSGLPEPLRAYAMEARRGNVL